MPMPIADWLRSLDEMETTLAAALSGLDGYERTWERTLVESVRPDGIRAPSHLTRLELRLGEWDSRLSAAADLAASAERESNERQAAIGRWQDLFNDWRRLIEQPAKPAARTS